MAENLLPLFSNPFFEFPTTYPLRHPLQTGTSALSTYNYYPSGSTEPQYDGSATVQNPFCFFSEAFGYDIQILDKTNLQQSHNISATYHDRSKPLYYSYLPNALKKGVNLQEIKLTYNTLVSSGTLSGCIFCSVLIPEDKAIISYHAGSAGSSDTGGRYNQKIKNADLYRCLVISLGSGTANLDNRDLLLDCPDQMCDAELFDRLKNLVGVFFEAKKKRLIINLYSDYNISTIDGTLSHDISPYQKFSSESGYVYFRYYSTLLGTAEMIVSGNKSSVTVTYLTSPKDKHPLYVPERQKQFLM